MLWVIWTLCDDSVLNKNLNNVQRACLSITSEFADLRLEGDGLVVIVFGGFAAVDEISVHENSFYDFRPFDFSVKQSRI